MKQAKAAAAAPVPAPAAFGRLCVETIRIRTNNNRQRPAAFGRLCVETRFIGYIAF